MKGKKFIAIMAILIILCSIQVATAFEDNNITQADVQLDNVLTTSISEVDEEEISNESVQIQSDDSNNQFSDVKSSDIVKSSINPVNGNSGILGLNNDEVLGITAGTFIYGVDYDTQYADKDQVPLERFFKALYWGIRDYVQSHQSVTEWDVFLNNKTFVGGYGDAGVGTIQTGYLSPDGYRVNYLTFNGLNFNKNLGLTIHLYGGATKDDGKTSTLDLTNYGANYALLDFSIGKSSITGINFKNFDVNKHPSTVDPDTDVPFIKLADSSVSSQDYDAVIKNCTFENITLNPNQPMYAVGNVGSLHFNNVYSTSSLQNFFKFVFWQVRDKMGNEIRAGKTPTREWNVFLDNNTFTGGYGAGGVDAISTGYYSWDSSGSSGRAKYLTFRNINPRDNSFSENFNITINLYGGKTKTDAKTSTLDLSQYGADYRLIDLSGGSSTITGVNFKNFDVNKYTKTKSESTSMPFIFLGDEKIQNYKSGFVNCSFENITLNPKQPMIRMAYMDSSSEIMNSGGVIDGCTFKNITASQVIAIAGSPSDGKHRDDGPVFYGFNASNNRFIGNTGTQEFNSTAKSLGLSFKLWNEVVNATLHNNTFINNTNAVHGAAYCIIGTNITITNNWIEGNQAIYGAGIESHVGNITIKDSVFINNLASGNHSQNSYRDGSGVAIALLGSNNYIYNCTFINNTAEGHAGAIDIVGGKHNVTKEDGTQVLEYLTANNTVIENSLFYHNIAYDYAGGVHINGTNTRIDNCTFEDNNASFAGATRLIGENVTIINSTFNENNAIQGGACYIEGENAHIYDSIFTNNNATRTIPKVRGNAPMITAGGALSIVGNNTIVTNNKFNNNSANAGTSNRLEGLGGALYMTGRNLTFHHDNFTDNIATQGGAAYISGNSIHANVMNFTNNRAVQGGAVYIEGNKTKITKSTFKDNNASAELNPNVNLNVNGGAVLIIGYNTNITESNFTNNYAINGNGGAISIDGHSADILSNEFKENEAIRGGAIFIDSISTYSNIIGANFTDNAAILGGAIFIEGSETKIGNVDFKGNNATHRLSFDVNAKFDRYNSMGGAIGINGNKSVIYNATFSQNTAVGEKLPSYGGAIAIQGNDTTLENTDFEYNQAIIGGAIYYRGSLNDINDTEFRHNAAIQGGAVYIDKSGVTFGNSRFYNNSATHELRFTDSFDDMLTIGGAVNIPGNNTYVYDCEFINNTAYGVNANGGLGGAIAVNGSNDHIVNSKFENNQGIQGGAFYLDGDEVYIVESNFTNNRAIQGGAGFIDGVKSYVEDSLFEENYATHNDLRFPVTSVLENVPTEGGAVHIYGENINIISAEFIKNHANAEDASEASTGGGAIYVEGKNATISESKFSENTALKGGAVFIVVDGTNVVDSNFTANSAFNYDDTQGMGGAIYIENAQNTDISGSAFENNTASINGGAVNWHESCTDGKIIDSTFNNNSAEINGGAVFWDGKEGTIENSNFTDNTAVLGGALYWSAIGGEISGSRFISNDADYGGAIYLENTNNQIKLSIKDSHFENNTAVYDGGAINWNNGYRVDMNKDTFVNNTAVRGGAVFIEGMDGTIANSDFTLNEAILGGAAYLNNEALTVSGSNFDYNNAVQGGAVYIGGSNDKISNSNFNYNNATYTLRLDTSKDKNKTKGGAIYIAGENNIIEKSKFYNNTANATNDTAIIVQTTPGLLGAYLDVTGVDDDGLGGAIYVGANNNKFNSNEFDYNVARNGSAIYNNASGTYFKGDLLIKNQAWSYVLEVNSTLDKYYYGDPVEINVYNYVAGDNILNGIYNAKDVADVTFNDVSFIIKDDESQIRSTVARNVNPVLGAKEGVLYQDSLERYQPMVVEIFDIKTGQVVRNKTILTDLYGNHTFDVMGLAPSNYSIKAYHPEDRNYKYIVTANIFEILPIVDLSIIKGVEETPVLLGDNVVFTIIVSNAANATNATNVNINEVLPAGLTIVDIETTAGNYISSRNVWHIDTLANGTDATLVITAKTSQVGLFNNSVNVSCDQKEWDYTNNNDTVEFGVIKIVELDIVKTVDQNDTEIGDVVTFTIVVTNNGLSNATNVVIKDNLPSGLQLESGQLDHVVPFLDVGESYTFTVTAKTTQKGHFTNTVEVTCDENTTVKSANATVDVYAIDLKIDKQVNVSQASIDDLVNFTIVVKNHGNAPATNVCISDVLPHEFEFISAGGPYERNHQNIVWIIENLGIEQEYTVWIVAKALYNGTYTNVAHVNCSEEPTVKNSTATVKVLEPVSLNVTKVANDDDFGIGDEVTFTITITNMGEENATNIVVKDVLPDGLTLIEGSLDQTIALLEGGKSVNVTIKARTTVRSTFTNVVSVYCSENDTVVSDNATVNVYVVDLRIHKDANVSEAKVNDLVNFTIVVRDHGNNVATNVRISDVLPDGFEFVSASGNYARDGQNIVWTIGRLPAEQDYAVWIVARALTSGTFDNVAHVNCSEEPTVKNSTATVKVLKPVNLNITKVANDDDFAIGDEVTFTITVTNLGDENATNVIIEDILPEGLELCEDYNLEHIIPHLAGGESISVTIKAKTTVKGTFTNVAFAYCHENTTIVSDNATVNVYAVDMKIHKYANVSEAKVNDLINFTIVVRDHGNDVAINVRISDALDDAFEIVSASGDYKIDGQNIVWIIDNLPAEQDCVVWVVVRALTNGTFDNVAHVNCSQEPTVKNGTATVVVYNPDLSVTKEALDDFVYSGNKTSFKIIVTNIGDKVLNNVFVDEIIPEGLIYDTVIGSNWIENDGVFYYEHSLGVGESVELIVVVNTFVSGNFTNNVVVGADDVDDHVANATVTVYTPSLTVREISNTPNVIVGNPVSFTVTVTNDGDCVLGDIYVTNIFPEGLIYTSFEGENWTKVGNRFVYSGVLKPGETISYTLYFNTTQTGKFTAEVIAGSNLTSNTTSKAYSNNTTVVVAPGIALIKVADKNTVTVGELVSFTITVTNTGGAALNGIYVIDELPDGLVFVSFAGDGWSKVGNTYYYSGSLAPSESVSFTIVCNATKVCNVTNIATVFSDLVGNVSAQANVSVVNSSQPVGPVGPVEPVTPKPVNVSVDSKATGNPIMLLLLIILACIPLRRRKQ